jgi:hypothetical protein
VTPENIITLNLHLSRMEAGFVTMVRNAIDPEMVASAVKGAISRFDFDGEVQKLVDREIRSAVQNAVERGIKMEMEAIRRRAQDASERAAARVRQEISRAMGVL